MPFKKGHDKFGGRQKGTPNTVTQQHRELINSLISCPENLEEDLKQLSPKDRMDAIIKLLEFTTPKQSRVDTNITGDLDVSSIIFKDAKGSRD